ncbi:MAG: SPOR domain-containing protein [Gemmatimonadota bacterium]|nr:MAG: SPOR domain-containing protein [Gemmatimonadota bacterium]
MYGRCVSTFVMSLLLLCAGLVCVESTPCQTQPEGSSAQDTVSREQDIETPPTVTREKIEYRSQGRKDPFKPLVETEEEEELPPLQVDGATVSGIMLGSEGRLALIRDGDGRTYVLGEGAKVKNGYLRRITTDTVIFNVVKYGRYRRVELELKSAKKAQEFEQSVARTARQTKPAQPKPAQPKPAQPKPEVTQAQVKPPKVDVPPEQMKGSTFTLQVAAYRLESDAKRLQQWLRERGYETRIESITIPESGLWYRVRFGVYDTYEAVKEMAKTFRERFDFYCWVVPIDS